MIPNNLPDHIAIDTETNGLDRHNPTIRPCGITVAHKGGSFYLPYRHLGGGNLPEEQVIRWAKNELRNKTIEFVNPGFDLHMLKKDGIDLEAQGCKPRCVQFKAALLDDHRRKFDLDSMSLDYLKKGKLQIDHEKIHEFSGEFVAPYATKDAELTYSLGEYFDNQIGMQNLQAVAQLEDDLIYCVLSMEEKGIPIDVPKLHRWNAEVELALRIEQGKLGHDLNVKSGKQLESLFNTHGIPVYYRTKPSKRFPSGQSSFTEEALRDTSVRFPHPFLEQILGIRWLRTLKEKFEGYIREVNSDGILHYNLHQCRTDGGGAVSGRFSSSKVNIQQVCSVDNQEEITRQWIVRELFQAPLGRLWCSADASQIEFRLFSHYANAERLIQAYIQDPRTDFHAVVAQMTGLSRKIAKNVNFMALYGGGKTKFMYMMKLAGMPVDEVMTDQFYEEYESEFPEAKQLMKKASKLAERRGFVKTLMGRRARFSKYGENRYYSALNRIIQGSAADIMKIKLLQVYNECRNYFDLRFTVHDSIDGFIIEPEKERLIKEVLDGPIKQFNLKVPIVWKTGIGKTWAEASK